MSAADIRNAVFASTEAIRSLAPQYARPELAVVVSTLLDALIWRSVVLAGPRRVGKSRLLFQLAQELPRRVPGAIVVYHDFTVPALRGDGLAGIVAAFEVPAGQEPHYFFLFDEVHHVDGWAEQLTDLVNRRAAKVVVADSSATVLTRARESLGVGRWTRVDVDPLSFGQWLDLRKVETGRSNDLPPSELADACRTWIRLGGFPEYALEEARLSYVHRLLNEDVVLKATRFDVAPLAGIRRPDALEAVLDSLLRQSGKELAWKDLPGEESGPTHRSWLRALLDSGLIWELPQSDRSEGRRARGKPKIYSVDPALVAAKHPGAPAPPGGPWPAMVETAAAVGLRRQARAAGAEIGWAGKSGAWEVDFVHLHGGRCTAIEVTVGPPAKKLARLRRAVEAVRADRGLVVHDSFDRPRVDEVTGAAILPLHDFLLALEGRPAARWAW